MTIQRLAIAVSAVFVFALGPGPARAAAIPAPIPGAANAAGPDLLVIAGDSTACIYVEEMPYRGWGMFIPPYLKPTIQVENMARPGRSVSTFMLEGIWKNALKKKPKFILIQFGTNDAHDQHSKEGVDPEIGYPMFLDKYVTAALATAAVPVLITPAHPRYFNKITGKLIDVLGPYVKAMHDVAQKRGVAMIDLYAASGELYQVLGDEASARFEPVKGDRVHFNALGAKTMAELIMRRFVKVEPRIVPYLGPDPMLLGGGQEAQAQQ